MQLLVYIKKSHLVIWFKIKECLTEEADQEMQVIKEFPYLFFVSTKDHATRIYIYLRAKLLKGK